MKWFKHMSNMRHDVKIRRLISKHGAEGYAVYNFALEAITERLDEESPWPDLEETAEDIAEYLKMDTVKVERIMLSAMENGLFSQDETTGRMLCHKLYKFLDTSTTRSKQIAQLVQRYKEKSEVSDTVRDSPGLSALEETRLEETRLDGETKTQEQTPPKAKEATKKEKHPTLQVPISRKRYDTLAENYGTETVDRYIQRILDYCASKGKRYKDYAATAANWIDKDEREGKGPARKNQPDTRRVCSECGKKDPNSTSGSCMFCGGAFAG